MPQQVRRRQHETITYTANAKESATLSRGMILRHLMLRLQGQPTITAMNNSAANTLKAEEWGILDRIDLIANGSDVIKSFSGEQLWWLNYFLFGTVPPVTATLGDGSTANPSFDVSLLLPFWMPRSVRPFDTALDARQLSDLKLEITWGSHTSINSAATGFTTNPTLEVYALESFNPPNAAAFSTWRLFQIIQTITAANAAQTIKLPVGPLYRGFLINTIADAADVATVINNIKVKSGTTVFVDLPEDVLRLEYRQMNGVPIDAVGRRSSSSSVNGWYMLDLVTDGRLSEAIDTLGFAEFELELNVAAPGTARSIELLPFQIIPVRGG